MPGTRSRSSGEGILVTGGTGFVGSVVTRLLLARRDAPVRVLARRPPAWLAEAGADVLRGDLTEHDTLRGACDGISAVVHLAGHIGGDEKTSRLVNAEGTAALLAEARKAGVGRIVYVSTTSVYGFGAHRGDREDALRPAPASPTSRGKALAEREVLAAGGIVLRPHLVYGTGDRWFVPTLLRLLLRVPAWIDGGRARATLVSVDDLAAVIAELAVTAEPTGQGEVFHVGHPEPVSMRHLIHTVCGHLGLRPPRRDLPAARFRELAGRAVPGLTDHQFSLLAEDHWYDTGRIWRRTGLDPGPGLDGRFPAAVPWYRRWLTERQDAEERRSVA